MTNNQKRKRARRYAMQALYSWLISENNISEVEAYYLDERNPERYDVSYFKQLIHTIPEKLDEIDTAIKPYLHKSNDHVDPIEQIILRISTYELLYCDELPFKVIINEALELAKQFGATDSFKFVNGVLDPLAKSVRNN